MRNFKSVAVTTAMGASLATAFVIGGSLSASAVELYNKDGTKIEFTAEIGIGLYSVSQDYNLFGLAARAPISGNVNWSEGYAIMGFKAEHALDANWKIFGAFTGVVNGVRGQGDAIASSIGTEDGGQVQDAYGGVEWTSGVEGGASVKLSGGRQKWVQGDGFVIAGDQPTSGVGYGQQYDEGGAYYLNPRRVFAQTVILNVETGTPFRFDAYYIESEKGQNGQRAIAGGNIDYVDKTYGTIGFQYIRGLDVEDPLNTVLPFTPATDGMNLFSVYGNTSFGIKDFTLSGRYVDQQSDNVATCFAAVQCAGLDAYAFYISPSYTFSAAAWTPTIYYRFASFSGDDANTADNEGYDPLFYGATGFNTWFIGEIAANYSGPFSSNADVHTIGIKTAPNIDIGIGKWTGLSGYLNNYSFRETAPGLSKDFGTELAVYAEFQLFENLYLSPLYSVLWTDKGYDDFYGPGLDDTVHNFQILGILTY
jgi:hypothetical protein